MVSLIFLITGCGVSQEEYSQVYAELAASQAQVTELQADCAKANGQLLTAQAQVAQLQWQIDQLRKQYELVGDTPATTAQNIVGWYYRTHIYSGYDSFVCGDMAIDVWDMLKAQGIHSILQIGNAQKPVRYITDTNHTWVQVEISPGKYLALDPTVGRAVWEKENPLYYIGWLFDNPKEYKESVAGGGSKPIDFPETPSHVPGVD